MLTQTNIRQRKWIATELFSSQRSTGAALAEKLRGSTISNTESGDSGFKEVELETDGIKLLGCWKNILTTSFTLNNIGRKQI
ncbi:unnamed protein product [Allacma fusca]|uniref:Uncharacterized protein n=1 Tax=Allacma fusca TaxID=39272 RepID=A0A8J2LHC3_9HEXA|nr:unnamed protein product [Allacma fusca]